MLFTLQPFNYCTLFIGVGGGGFEPPKAEPTDLQSAPFDRFGIPPGFQYFNELSQQRDSNPRPADYKSAALPTELCWHFCLYSELAFVDIFFMNVPF